MTLALKYRPTRFQDLIGQQSVSQTLSLALDQKKISNAYLFSGLRGSGKTSSARIFARALQCDEGPSSTPCETCDNCRASLEGRHMDIIELDAASNRRIDDIRDLIEQTKYKPGFGRYKIFIIDEVHMLTKEAFNALLKTLEEPPEFVKFILATTDPLLMPATILSRTQHFRFKKIPHKSVLDHLIHILNQEGVPYEEEALHIIARSGSGSLRDTLTLLEQAIIFGSNTIKTQSVTEMLGIIDPQILERFFTCILEKDLAGAEGILGLMQEYEAEMVIDEMMIFLKGKALQKAYNTTLLNRFFSILTQSKTLLSLNSDGEFVLLLLLLKMQEATKLRDIRNYIAQLSEEIPQPLPQRISSLPPQRAVSAQDPAPSSPSSAPIHPASPTPIPDAIPNTNSLPSSTPSTPHLQSFERLIALLYDRNYELGELFEHNLSFVSFDGKSLELAFKNEDAGVRLQLRERYALIKPFITQVFGSGVQVKTTPSQTEASPTSSPTPQPIPQEATPQALAPQEPSQAIPNPEDPIQESNPPQDNPQEASQAIAQASQDNSQEPNFALRHQDLLRDLKKHLQIDLKTARKL